MRNSIRLLFNFLIRAVATVVKLLNLLIKNLKMTSIIVYDFDNSFFHKKIKNTIIHLLICLAFSSTILNLNAQNSSNFYNIIEQVSRDNIKEDVRVLANFGTRHTLSDTLSQNRGIGAARRWIFDQFRSISENCNGCLEVFYQKIFMTLMVKD